MTDIKAVPNVDDLWDTGKLGRDEKHVKVSSPESGQALDEGLELQMISIRLQNGLIEQLKFIAEFHRIGYQPMIRDVLCRWARTEILSIARQMQEQIEASEIIEEAKKQA